MEGDSAFWGYSRVREYFTSGPGIQSLQMDDGYNGRVGCKIRVLLTFFLSITGVPLPLRDVVLCKKRSKKLNLTG